MIKIFIIFLVLVLGIIVGPMIAGHQGIAYFQVASYRAKMSFTTFIFIEALFFLILYFIYWLSKKIFNSKTTLGSWLRARSPKKSAKRIEQAQWLLLTGDHKAAAKLLSKSAKHANNSNLIYLQAAQSYINSNHLDEANRLLTEMAKTCGKKNEFAFKLIQLRLLTKQQDYQAAQRVLDTLLNNNPRHPEVLRLAEQLYYQTQNYQAIIDMIPALIKAKAYPEEQLAQLKKAIYIERIKQLSQQNETPSALIRWWKSLPRSIRNNEVYQKTIASYLQQLHLEDQDAKKLLSTLESKLT